MTSSRADIPRLAASLGVLGTELEQKGQVTWDRLEGWEPGPIDAPGEAGVEVCGCGHEAGSHLDGGICTFEGDVDGSYWACACDDYDPATSDGDRSQELAAAARAGQQHAEFRADLKELDRLAQSLMHRIDMACPPTMEALRNRRTGEFDPDTAADAIAFGFCPNCWACGVRHVPLSPTEGKDQIRRYGDRCRPCGDFRTANDGLDKPKELVQGHAQIPPKRFKPEDQERIINAARAAAQPGKKNKGGKRNKKRAA